MFTRKHLMLAALGLTSSVALIGSTGCAVQSGGEAPAGKSAAAISYAPLGFARVSATGSVVTQYNSATPAATVVHTAGTGAYTVQFAGLASGYDGHAQVTAEGAGNERCRILSWFPNGTTQTVNVQCNRPDGSAVDAAFAALFYRYVEPTTTSTFTSIAYLWAHAGTAPAGYNYNGSGNLNTVRHNSVGDYTVTIPKASAYNASIMVTAYGGTGAPFCQVGYWGSSVDTTIDVKCWSTTGAPADGDFSLSYATSGPTLDQQGGHAWFDGTGASTWYSAAMAQYECGSATVTGSRSGNLASVVVSGNIGSWDATPLRRASFVSGYGSSPMYCKVGSESVTVSGPTSTGTTTAKCYNGAGSEVVPTFTFTHVTSDAAGPC